MNQNQINLAIFFAVSMVVAVFVGLYFAEIKGKIGEKKVGMLLSTLPKDRYRVVNNVMLQTETGTTQIDHIVVSVYGVFVIETKNYKGWIYGREYDQKWTENLYGRKYKFYNPMRQNYGHVMALTKTLNLPENYFIPIVTFSNDTKLKITASKPVVNFRNLTSAIKCFQTSLIPAIELDAMATKLKFFNIDSHENRKTHVKAIREKKERY